MSDKNNVILHLDYRQHLELLTNEQRGNLLMAIFDYAESQILPELDAAAMMAFSFIRAQIDRDSEKYRSKCDKNRQNVTARWSQPNTVVYDRISGDTKHTNNNDNDNDNDNDNKKKEIKKKTNPPSKSLYGEFQNVSLTGEEHRKLVDSFGNKAANDYVERLSAYLAQTGKTYKSHYAALLNWKRRDKPNEATVEPDLPAFRAIAKY